MNHHLVAVQRPGAPADYDAQSRQAFQLVASSKSRQAFELNREPDHVRERYGRLKFGQSLLLARRLVEAGVPLIRVNWSRDLGGLNKGEHETWDTHVKNHTCLKTFLMPVMDQAYSALLEDLSARGLLDETLVVWMGEFGRSPRINGGGGRDRGAMSSAALAGGARRPRPRGQRSHRRLPQGWPGPSRRPDRHHLRPAGLHPRHGNARYPRPAARDLTRRGDPAGVLTMDFPPRGPLGPLLADLGVTQKQECFPQNLVSPPGTPY